MADFGGGAAGGSQAMAFYDLDFAADTQGSQYEYNDFTLPSQSQTRTLESQALVQRARGSPAIAAR